jgi:hypothetical protein
MQPLQDMPDTGVWVGETQLTLEEKKAELSPRIALPDFLQLRPWATVLDTRDEDEYVGPASGVARIGPRPC